MLVTAPARQYFENGKITAVPGHHGGTDAFGDFPYVRAVRQLGREEDVIVLDLFARSCELLERLGESAAQSLQSIKDENGATIGEARYGRVKKWVEDYDAYWETRGFSQVDNTHQNRLGSYLFAAILSDCIYEQIPDLGKCGLACASKEMCCPERIHDRIPQMESVLRHVEVRIV